MLKTLEYKDEELIILDQTLLPVSIGYINLATIEDVYDAIIKLRVRGAPLIGITAAYGVLVGIKHQREAPDLLMRVEETCDYLKKARPTAINLSWALNRMLNVARSVQGGDSLYDTLVKEAQNIHTEDIETNKKIGEQTYQLVKDKITNNSITVLTHCNAGALATTGYGTATSVIYLLKELGVEVKVYACETRPLLQGARLTALELSKADIEVIVITDSMAAAVIAEGLVDFVIVGADRVVANLDVANKIGTLGLSLIAQHYHTPFFVACPSSTLDANTACGKDVVIEQRDGSEITTIAGARIAPTDIKTYNPAFDITPHENITAIITENGILERLDQ